MLHVTSSASAGVSVAGGYLGERASASSRVEQAFPKIITIGGGIILLCCLISCCIQLEDYKQHSRQTSAQGPWSKQFTRRFSMTESSDDEPMFGQPSELATSSSEKSGNAIGQLPLARKGTNMLASVAKKGSDVSTAARFAKDMAFSPRQERSSDDDTGRKGFKDKLRGIRSKASELRKEVSSAVRQI